MPFYRTANGFRDHESDLRAVGGIVVGAAGVHDEVGLHRPHPLVDGGTELRRPRYPVPRRKHRARPCVESRSQRTAALATPVRHDGPPARVRIRSRNPCTRARRRLLGWKVRLPLATAVSPRCVWHPHPTLARASGDAVAVVSSSVSLASRRGLQKNLVAAVSPRSGDCSRVLRDFAGSNLARPRRTVHSRHSRHDPESPARNSAANVAERLALRDKTVSFWQCRFDAERRADEARMPNSVASPQSAAAL